MTPRVLHVGKFYPPVSGGMEKVLQVVCEAERDVAQSEVLVANDRRGTVREIVDGVSVTRVGALTKVGAVAVCPTFPLWLHRRAAAADIVVVHEPNPLAIVAHALVRPRARTIVWVHAEVVRPQWRYRMFYRPFLSRLLRRASRIVVASPPMLDHAAELQPYRDKCVVIPYAIDPERYATTAPTADRVGEVRGDDRRPLVLFVGRMVPYKGVDVLLRALAGTTARAVLVGNGPMRGEWQQLADALGVSDRVRFAGEVSAEELAALYSVCDLFVLPSITRAEAFGMVQLEAMAHGKPVVSTQLPSGVPWVNQDGVTGLVVPPGDAAALAAAIDRLAGDPDLRTAMGQRGCARIADEFTVERLRDRMRVLYRDVIDRPTPTSSTRPEAA